MATAEERCSLLVLPPIPKPAGNYVPCVLVGSMAYVSGQGPWNPDGTGQLVGKVSDIAYGQKAARFCGLAVLAALKSKIGSLNRVKQVVKCLGMVNGTPEFEQHPKVINGFSDLMAEVFGPETGVGARSAVGMGTLPFNISVEVECIFELHPSSSESSSQTEETLAKL